MCVSFDVDTCLPKVGCFSKEEWTVGLDRKACKMHYDCTLLDKATKAPKSENYTKPSEPHKYTKRIKTLEIEPVNVEGPGPRPKFNRLDHTIFTNNNFCIRVSLSLLPHIGTKAFRNG